MDPAILKSIHLGSVLLSYLLFLMRGVWMLRVSPILQQRWIKIAPHTVDTILLASAIMLATQLNISPFSAPWLMAKIMALVLYIALGTIGLKRGKTRQARLTAWLAAQAVFFYIVSVALTHDPLPWRAL